MSNPAHNDVTTRGPLIAPMTAEHAEQVPAICQLGIDEGQATFETTAPTWPQFDAAKLPGHRHVALDGASGRVLGWVATSAVSACACYAGVAERSIHIHPGATAGADRLH
ncbi:hypothetical protein AB0I81_00315 [Nonomuraea sp. NPDC050404]|uniref:GNAT family N-acetyltransferase n=1 Tax=Nonomuraea sp. NPDC050404 TaxID=3155783 RepID=UPI0033F5AD83